MLNSDLTDYKLFRFLRFFIQHKGIKLKHLPVAFNVTGAKSGYSLYGFVVKGVRFFECVRNLKEME